MFRPVWSTILFAFACTISIGPTSPAQTPKKGDDKKPVKPAEPKKQPDPKPAPPPAPAEQEQPTVDTSRPTNPLDLIHKELHLGLQAVGALAFQPQG